MLTGSRDPAAAAAGLEGHPCVPLRPYVPTRGVFRLHVPRHCLECSLRKSLEGTRRLAIGEPTYTASVLRMLSFPSHIASHKHTRSYVREESIQAHATAIIAATATRQRGCPLPCLRSSRPELLKRAINPSSRRTFCLCRLDGRRACRHLLAPPPRSHTHTISSSHGPSPPPIGPAAPPLACGQSLREILGDQLQLDEQILVEVRLVVAALRAHQRARLVRGDEGLDLGHHLLASHRLSLRHADGADH